MASAADGTRTHPTSESAAAPQAHLLQQFDAALQVRALALQLAEPRVQLLDGAPVLLLLEALPVPVLQVRPPAVRGHSGLTLAWAGRHEDLIADRAAFTFYGSGRCAFLRESIISRTEAAHSAAPFSGPARAMLWHGRQQSRVSQHGTESV